MKKPMLLLLSIVAAGFVVVAIAEDKPRDKPTRNPELEELRTQVFQLRAQVQALESRMSKVEALAERSAPNIPSPLNSQNGHQSLNLIPAQNGSPKIWGEREVNGWTFYVVPCETAAR